MVCIKCRNGNWIPQVGDVVPIIIHDDEGRSKLEGVGELVKPMYKETPPYTEGLCPRCQKYITYVDESWIVDLYEDNFGSPARVVRKIKVQVEELNAEEYAEMEENERLLEEMANGNVALDDTNYIFDYPLTPEEMSEQGLVITDEPIIFDEETELHDDDVIIKNIFNEEE